MLTFNSTTCVKEDEERVEGEKWDYFCTSILKKGEKRNEKLLLVNHLLLYTRSQHFFP